MLNLIGDLPESAEILAARTRTFIFTAKRLAPAGSWAT